MTGAPTDAYWRSIFNRLKRLSNDDDGGRALQQLVAPSVSSRRRRPKSSRVVRVLPPSLAAGVAHVNALRRRAADGEGAADLQRIDAACHAALMNWFLSRIEHQPTPLVAPSPRLTAEESLIIGALYELDSQSALGGIHGLGPAAPGAASVVCKEWRSVLKIKGKLGALLRILVDNPQWLHRIRRCNLPDRSKEPGCFRFFIDRSPAGDARACSLSRHSQTLIEIQGAVRPWRRTRRSRP